MKSNPLIFIILGVVVLGGLFFVFKPKQSVPSSDTNTKAVQEETSSAVPSASAMNAKMFELVVASGKLVVGHDLLSVTQGDTVTIKITVDEHEELHIHGYDKSVDLEASKPAEVTFTANLTGRFPFELEHSKVELGALEVQPK